MDVKSEIEKTSLVHVKRACSNYVTFLCKNRPFYMQSHLSKYYITLWRSLKTWNWYISKHCLCICHLDWTISLHMQCFFLSEKENLFVGIQVCSFFSPRICNKKFSYFSISSLFFFDIYFYSLLRAATSLLHP